MLTLITNLFKPKLSEEAFWAYFNRMPEVINVKWFRDRDFIIGEVKISNKVYYTQGKNAEDFIDMVNDLVVTVCDIPAQYVQLVKDSRTYVPSDEELKKLENTDIKKSLIGLHKRKKECLQYA